MPDFTRQVARRGPLTSSGSYLRTTLSLAVKAEPLDIAAFCVKLGEGEAEVESQRKNFKKRVGLVFKFQL